MVIWERWDFANRPGGSVVHLRRPSIGEVIFDSSLRDGVIEAIIDPPTTRSPRRIVLWLRHPQGKPVKSVTVNGKNHEDFDVEAETINLPPGGKRLSVHVEY
jgi:hypothetical protein